MLVVVTGCAGFIGSHVSERLIARGDDVIGIDSMDPYYDPAIKWRNLDEVQAVAEAAEKRSDILGCGRLTQLGQLFAKVLSAGGTHRHCHDGKHHAKPTRKGLHIDAPT